MNITTNLHGRIKNTQLGFTRGLMPLFETVQNSIHAIEERLQDLSQGRIVIEIQRDKQSTLLNEDNTGIHARTSLPEITGFIVRDNGIGFTDKHMTSFETLDTDLKEAIGGRGVGRLLWLKVFRRASIDSVFIDDDHNTNRVKFDFTSHEGITNLRREVIDTSTMPETSVHLLGYDSKYRDASRKTVEAIAKTLFEHCLWYFIRAGGVPRILLVDGEQSIDLDHVYQQHMQADALGESFELKGNSFELTHIKLCASANRNHCIGWCASNRLVVEENIAGKIPGLHGVLGDNDAQFTYAGYVTSDYLDNRVRPERTGFSMEETRSAGLLDVTEISREELSENILHRAGNYLSTYLSSSRQASLARVKNYVATRQPTYRPIIARIPEEELYVDPEISDHDLDIELHKHKSKFESQLLSQGHSIMEPATNESIEDYEDRVAEYLKLVDDIKKSDLAEYVFHRKVILDLLEAAIVRSDDGSYAREELIHDLIMPMRKDSDSIEFLRNNLWLISERLTFHNFLASDKPLRSMPITDSEDEQRPDILALNVYDESILLAEAKDLPLASIVVIELKSPMRKNFKSGEDRDPIEQTLSYLRRIRAGEVKTASGRPIPDSADIPGFCYVICDLTPSIKKRCELQGLQITSDHMGYFGYNHALKAYIEVNSFDQIHKSATERNKAFFGRLGLPDN